MIVLDTNVISELMRPKPETTVVNWLDQQDPSNVWLTSITVAELMFGVALLPQGKRKTAISAAVSGVVEESFSQRILSFDVEAARDYAQIASDRSRLGKPISTADAQIAAICRSRSAVLTTRNGTDFDSTGVEIFNPWLGEKTS